MSTHFVHCIPINDKDMHYANKECWCKPLVDDQIVIHHAADRREIMERLGKKTKHGWIHVGEIK